MRPVPAILGLIAACASAWCAEGASLEVRLLGQVAIDSGATKAVDAPAKDLVVDQVGGDGRVVAAGEVVIGFDPRLVRLDLDDKRQAAAIARLDLALWQSGRDADLAALESERRRLRGDLAATRAAIAASERADPFRVAQLDAERDNAELHAALAERDAARSADDAAHGLVSAAAAATAQHDADLARVATVSPILAWRLVVDPPRESTELALLRIHERDLAVRLGLGRDGTEDESLGIGLRLASARKQVEADQAAKRGDLDKAEAELRQAERDARDHTPLVQVTVAPAAGGAPVQRIRFAPADCPVPEGWTADHGEAFSAQRGFGWNRRLGEELVQRVVAKPANAGGGGPRRGGGRPAGDPAKRPAGGPTRGKGGPPVAPFEGGLALITEPLVWSIVLPDGRWKVSIGLGDDRDWDGPSLRAEGVALGLPERVGPGLSEQTVEVQVHDGRLDLAVGDGVAKAWRAPTAGVVVHQEIARRGFHVEDPSQTLAYLADASALVVDALVPQELASLLAGRAARAEAPVMLDRLGLAGVDLVRSDGTRLPAEVVAVGAQSVRWTRGPRDWGVSNPADNLARDLRLRVAGGRDAGLRVGETLTVALRLALPPGAGVLPAHLVRIDRDGALVREDGKQHPVLATRIGDDVVVDRALDQRHLSPPGERQELAIERAAGRFRGEVVPGGRTRVALAWVSGRVGWLVPDGSQVTAGQLVMSIYDPQLEADRERIDRERQSAIRKVAANAERRHQDLLRLRADHDVRVAAELEARVRLRRHLDDDPLANAQAIEATARSGTDLTAATGQRDRLAKLSAPPRDDVADAAAAVQRARIATDQAVLAAAALEVAPDWLLGQQLAGDWADKVRDLGRRESELAETALQERINTLADRIAMERAVEGDWRQRRFAEFRQVKAPVSGRILFQTGWNDQAGKSEKIGKEFPVWGSMTVADIVDESRLGFTAELSEDRFPDLAAGRGCELELADAPGRVIKATLTDIGRAFTIPRDRLQSEDDREAVSNRRVFQVTATFVPPADLHGRLTTGAKGWLRIP